MGSRWLLWWCGLIVAGSGFGQPALYLKPGAGQGLGIEAPALAPGFRRANSTRSHLILQFQSRPGVERLAELARRGIQALGYVPENGVVVSMEDGASLEGLEVARVRAFLPEGKLSALAAALGDETGAGWVVDFHPDTDPAAMREAAGLSGLRIREHPDLLKHQLLAEGRLEQLFDLAGWDEVAYIYPAARELMEGRPVRACAGAITELGAVAQYVARVGDGWAGPGHGAATLQYHLGQLTSKLAESDARAEIEKALREWARHARLTFVPGASATAPRTINVLFATGAHGDPYPFDGPSKTLAHTFYPSPPNNEPLAGDVHLDEDEPWRIGADTDLYSVVLHELGHALGLGHSDTPGAVMYPFYRRAAELTAEDIQALQELYAAPEAGGDPAAPADPAPGEPLRLSITAPDPATITAATGSVTLSGTLSGGVAPYFLSWSSDRGAGGMAGAATGEWRIPGVPLSPGKNTVTVIAADARLARAAAGVTITRETTAPPAPAPDPPPAPADTVAPSIVIQSPGSATVLVSSSSLTIRGSARDNAGVVEVSWSSSSGRNGVAQGTTSWVIPELPLLVGANTIIVRARDAAGNVGWRSLVVTRR